MKRNIISFLFLLATSAFIAVTTHAVDIGVTARVIDTTIVIDGYTEPGSIVTIDNFGIAMGTTIADGSGYFSREFTPVDPGNYQISVFAEDSQGNDTVARTFTFSIVNRQLIELTNVILPPTLYPQNSSIPLGSPFIVQVYGKPSQTVYLAILNGNSSSVVSQSTNSSGSSQFVIDSSGFSEGTASIYAYFDLSYPSGTKDIFILPAPSATPSPAPTATSTPTPIISPVQGSPGLNVPTATPLIHETVFVTTTPATGINPTSFPYKCPFPMALLCQFDTNTSGMFELNGDAEPLLLQFISSYKNSNQFDLNNDSIVDSQDLSILLQFIDTSGFTALFHESPSQLEGSCIAGSLSSGIFNAVLPTIVVVLILNILFYLVFLGHRKLGSVAKFRLMIPFLLITVIIAFLPHYFSVSEQYRTIQRSFQFSQGQKNTDISELQVNLSNTKELANTFDIILTFNPSEYTLENIDTSKSILPIITSVDYSQKCGTVRITGGLFRGAFFKDKELVTVVLKKTISSDTIKKLEFSQQSKAFHSVSGKTVTFTPEVTIVEVSK